MQTTLAFLERIIPDHPNQVYLLNYPVCTVNEQRQLTPLASALSFGIVTQLTLDSKNRYQITFSANQPFLLTKKKVAQTYDNPGQLDPESLLKANGYQLVPDFDQHLTTDQQFQNRLDTSLTNFQQLKRIPSRYITVDCEFGPFFKKHGVGNWQPALIHGMNTGIYQLSALSFDAHHQTELLFDHYLDNPYFLPEKQLTGLAETGLTLVEYQQQANPVTVLKAFINQVLASHRPLAFWDARYDLKCLRWLMATYYDRLTANEHRLIKQPFQLFDSELYTDAVINRANHQANLGQHLLPLNGVAGLLNIANPHQHNALWDALTIHHVIEKLTQLKVEPVQVLTAPQPPAIPPTLALPTPKTKDHKYQLVHQLRSTGQTYREIAATVGISISGVNYILKKHPITNS